MLPPDAPTRIDAAGGWLWLWNCAMTLLLSISRGFPVCDHGSDITSKPLDRSNDPLCEEVFASIYDNNPRKSSVIASPTLLALRQCRIRD